MLHACKSINAAGKHAPGWCQQAPVLSAAAVAAAACQGPGAGSALWPPASASSLARAHTPDRPGPRPPSQGWAGGACGGVTLQALGLAPCSGGGPQPSAGGSSGRMHAPPSLATWLALALAAREAWLVPEARPETGPSSCLAPTASTHQLSAVVFMHAGMARRYNAVHRNACAVLQFQLKTTKWRAGGLAYGLGPGINPSSALFIWCVTMYIGNSKQAAVP